jgi:glutathione S-transferase
MGSPKHLALHPFDRVPILRHGDFVLYETSAIVAYLEELFPTPSLEPDTPQDRARMHQWISAVNSYYYPYMIYHVGHERNVFPRLGIPSDEKVVAHALPKIEVGLQVVERQLSHGQGFLLGGDVTLADYYLLPSTYSFGRTPEGKTMYASFPVVQAWRERMEALPTVRQLRQATADLPPIEHARKWAVSHRPKY